MTNHIALKWMCFYHMTNQNAAHLPLRYHTAFLSPSHYYIKTRGYYIHTHLTIIPYSEILQQMSVYLKTILFKMKIMI